MYVQPAIPGKMESMECSDICIINKLVSYPVFSPHGFNYLWPAPKTLTGKFQHQIVYKFLVALQSEK